jgi:MFS family permease
MDRALYFYPYAIMQLPAGVLSDSWGPRKTITFFFLIAVIGSLIHGYADTVETALAGRLLVGIGVAMLFVPTMKILAEWFTIGELSILELYVLCFFMGFFTSAIVVIAFTSNKELFPVHIAGTSTGLINLFPFAGGAVFQQVLGTILDRHPAGGNAFTLQGYEEAFLVLFACSVVAFAVSFFIKETFA